MNIWNSPYKNSIVFIEENSSGEVWSNQVNGCACWHPEIKGFVHSLIENNDYSLESFNPKFWYDLYHRSEGYIKSKYVKKIKYKGVSLETSWDLYKNYKPLENEPEFSGDIFEQLNLQHNWRSENDPIYQQREEIIEGLNSAIDNSEYLIPFSVMTKRVELDLNKIRNSDMRLIRVTKPFNEGSVEAWVYVDVFYKNGEKKSGVVTWENCD